MKPEILLGLWEKGGVYSNYYKLRTAGIIKHWKEELARKRGQVDMWLFPHYHTKISFGNVVPNAGATFDADGLSSYGAVTVFLADDIFESRVSFFIEDCLHFYERFQKDHNTAIEGPPDDVSSDWHGLKDLALVKVGDSINSATSNLKLAKLLYSPDSTNKASNIFIEAHIFEEISVNAIAAIRLSASLTDVSARDAWVQLKTHAKGGNVMVSEKVGTGVKS